MKVSVSVITEDPTSTKLRSRWFLATDYDSIGPW